MSADWKVALGLTSIALTVVSYAPYLWLIHKRKNHPHIFSWIVWTIALAIVFAAQYINHAGPGMWVTGFTLILAAYITVLSWMRAEKNITRSDWVAFILALIALPVWYFTGDPLGAVILSALIELFGFYPTIRKSYFKPQHESLFSWATSALRSILAVFALENYGAVVILYPLAQILGNTTVTIILYWRRAVMRRSNPAAAPSL